MTDPAIERILDDIFAGEPHSRRRFIGRAGSAGLALSSLSAVLAACGGVEGTAKKTPAAGSTPVAVSHPKTEITQLNFSNWPLYIDKDVLKDFEKEFGGDVKYVEDVNDNVEFFGKVRQQLQQGATIKRDLVVLTDYMAARWVRDGYVEGIDKTNVPNFANLDDNLRSPVYDPERSYTLPWQSGATLIGYNPKKTGRKLNSVNDLFDPAFKGKVSFLAEPYDSASLTLLGMGVDPSTAKLDQVLEAIEKIEKANADGQIRRFTGNDYTTDLTKGNVWASVAYSGDLVALQADNPELEFLFPDEGAVLWNDNMMIPAKAEHPYAAEVMMNYVYEPEVALKIAEFVNYITPVKGTLELAESSDPELAKNELIFPSDELRAKLRSYPTLSPSDERTMQEAMAKVTGA